MWVSPTLRNTQKREPEKERQEENENVVSKKPKEDSISRREKKMVSSDEYSWKVQKDKD